MSTVATRPSSFAIPITRPWLPPIDEYGRLGPIAVELESQTRAYLGAGHLLSLSSGGRAHVVFEARVITNRALRDRFEGVAPGEVALAYDGKLLVPTRDGLLILASYAARGDAGIGRN